ncbi:hypothetical protein V8C86DRAFT_2520126 [Haematococcus lacustris]
MRCQGCHRLLHCPWCWSSAWGCAAACRPPSTDHAAAGGGGGTAASSNCCCSCCHDPGDGGRGGGPAQQGAFRTTCSPRGSTIASCCPSTPPLGMAASVGLPVCCPSCSPGPPFPCGRLWGQYSRCSAPAWPRLLSVGSSGGSGGRGGSSGGCGGG